MIRFLKERDITVFLAVRQDVFRWALSKYHGDGTGKAGHLQFKLASGSMDRADIPKIRVDGRRFERLLRQCEETVLAKKQLSMALQAAGVAVYPLLYEKFCSDKPGYFKELFGHLGMRVSEQECDRVFSMDGQLEKVHSNDIASFVLNHETISKKYGARYMDWHEV